MKRVSAVALALLTSAFFLWLLLTPAAIAEITRAVSHARPVPLLVAFAAFALVQWLRAWRFSIMTAGTLAPPQAALVRIAMLLNFFNFLLPMRLGELSYPVMMRQQLGHDFLHSAGVLMLARLFDLTAVVAILLGAAAVLGIGGDALGTSFLGLTAVGSALIPFVFIFAGQAVRARLAGISRLGSIAAKLTAGIEALRDRRAAIASVLLGYGMWLLLGYASILCASAVTQTVSPAAALLGGAAGNVAFALPINGIAGIGPAQAAWVAATTYVGVPWDDAVVSALTVHAVAVANAVAMGALAGFADLARWLTARASTPARSR